MQFTHIPKKGDKAAIGLRLSCSQITAPHVKSTVAAANVEPAEVPKRNSFPSRLPRCWSNGRPATGGRVITRLPPGAVALAISKGLLCECAIRPGLGLSV